MLSNFFENIFKNVVVFLNLSLSVLGFVLWYLDSELIFWLRFFYNFVWLIFVYIYIFTFIIFILFFFGRREVRVMLNFKVMSKLN